jgi:hypothetical protein
MSLLLLLLSLQPLLFLLPCDRYHPLPFRILSGLKEHPDPAAAAALAQLCVPPPRDEGRVMAIARMLRDLGFRVVVECPFGLPLNYSVYARRER